MPILRTQSGELRDQIRGPLYDTVQINSGDTVVGTRQWFTDVQGKSKARTNLRQNSALDRAVSFRVTGMAIDVQNFYAANYNALPIYMENSSVKLTVGEKDYWEGPMLFLAGRLDAFATSLAAPLCYQKFGVPSVQPVIFGEKHVVEIPPQQSFSVTWTLLPADITAAEIALAALAQDSNLKFVMSLKGIRRRPVQ
jgi:hypothetical protein